MPRPPAERALRAEVEVELARCVAQHPRVSLSASELLELFDHDGEEIRELARDAFGDEIETALADE